MDNIRYKILLVEDNKLDQLAFKRFVDTNAIPYDYTIVGSVAEARSVLDSGQFDAVVTDHALGDGTALDVLKSAENTPVVVVTGAGDEKTATEIWKAGAYDYLIKDLSEYLHAIPKTVANAINHKKIEEKVQLLSGAVMSTEDSVYITDTQGTIIFVNKAFCRTYGYKEEEIVGQNGNVLWIGKHQGNGTRSVFQTKTAGSNWEVGFYHRRKNESVFPVSLSRSPIKDAAGRDVAIVAVARDITERIIAEDKIRTTSQKLKKKNHYQNEVSIFVAEAVRQLLATGQIETAQMVITDYLDISRIDANKMKLAVESFDLAEAVAKSIEDLAPSATKLNVDLENSTPAGKLLVNADPGRIAQIFRILLKRAIQSSGANSHVSVVAKDTGNEITVEIHDEGLPLERDEIQQIVDCPDWIREQFQAGRQDMALGLRLAIELVEMHGGRVWTERSDSNRNTLCFTVSKSGVRHSQQETVEMSSAAAD
ncbi:MAG: PAS domain S-box protein [Phycisphaerales bacterium]|nr:MAG: PAS domain S-box protein [Phycisphaerales bacterium]